MFIARWHIEARFGHKQTVLDLLQQWDEEVGSQVGWTRDKFRIVTGSIGAKEAEIQTEVEVESLAALEAAFAKLGSIERHAEWGREVEEYIVSGSTYWEIFRVVT